MPVSRNLKRLKIEKIQKKSLKIREILKKEKAIKEHLVKILNENIQKKNKPFLSVGDLYQLLLSKPKDFDKKMKKLRYTSYLVDLLGKYQLTHLILDIKLSSLLSTDMKIVDIIKVYFKDFPEINSLIRDLNEIKKNFKINSKKTEVARSSALNQVDPFEKLKKLDYAIKIATWGSIETSRVLADYVLIYSGENIGKNQESLILDKKNQKNQKNQKKATA